MTLPRTPSFRLAGREALVTGASSGIGRACAVALAEAGAHVTCVARSVEPLDDLVSQLEEAGLEGTAIAGDITDSEFLDRLFSQAYDIVVNAAGMARHSAATETTANDFDAVTELNLKAAYFLSQKAAKSLIANGSGGSIIHISSQMGHVGGPERAVYCATKHAVEGMIKAMALEWGQHGIRINSICPTFVRTPLTEPTFADPAKREWIMRNIALGRPAEVEDLMGATVFLASDAAAMVTGTSLLVDGGWTAA